jgi:hypothetical protein
VIPTASSATVRQELPLAVVQVLGTVGVEQAEALFLTVIVCAIFARKFKAEEVSWNLVVKKAKSWVSKESLKLFGNLDVDWEKQAVHFLSTFNLQ